VAKVMQRRNVPLIALGAIAIALAILIFHDILFPPAASTLARVRTAIVGTGTVTNSVSATGTLVPSQQMNLGFKTAGTLTEVDAKVGDVVNAGQVLAKIDTAPLDLALQQAQAALASAQAQLANTQSGTALQQSTDQLAQANQSYSDAVSQANQTNTADQSQLTADEATLSSDNATLSLDKGAYWYSQYGTALQAYQAALNTDQTKWQTDACTYASVSATCSADATAIQADQASIACTQGTSMVGCSFAQQQMAAAYKAAAAAQGQVSADASKVSADSSKLSADQSAGQRSVQQAQNSITNAQDSYNSQAINRPATIAQQSAQVAAAQVQAQTARSNLDAAILSAPMAGVVAAVSAQAGDAVSAGGSSSGSQAPGTTALLPSSGSTGSGSGSGGGGFLTLIATSSYITVVSMAESDAAKVQGGQTGTVTFDAISGLTIPVHVLAVAGTATTTSNVVNYYVTLALDSTDSHLRSGLTTNATVVTARAAGVLTVQNSAITHRGTQAFVTLLQAGKTALTQVTLGVAGSSATEVLTGLKAGDVVVLPTVTTTGTTTTRGAGGGGGVTRGGGGGGGGLGLGG
jgi:multidrug efflux pump subunit AcrA (membrane-fusion protein)